MPPLLEGNFSRLMAVLGFLIAILCIRIPTAGRLIQDFQNLKNSWQLASYHQLTRNFRRLIILSCVCSVVLFVVFVISIILIFQSYSCLSAVARNVRGSDQVILDYWIRQAESANGLALISISILAALLLFDFVLDVSRDLFRAKLPIYRSLHHPFELMTLGPRAPLFLWEQRIGWASSKATLQGSQSNGNPSGWREKWEDWVRAVDLYWDQYPEWQPSEEGGS